ncbi:hypothetical protein BJP26_14040 [Sphingomonas melonis TY]|nr:hypothetical protein BJP26_14040 [Sphingomonas melonis TY]
MFNITKPYFNLDQDLRFRQLGTLRNRGIEASVAGEVLPGLSIVAGTLLLDPEVRGEEVAAGLIGRRPSAQSNGTVSSMRIIGLATAAFRWTAR